MPVLSMSMATWKDVVQPIVVWLGKLENVRLGVMRRHDQKVVDRRTEPCHRETWRIRRAPGETGDSLIEGGHAGGERGTAIRGVEVVQDRVGQVLLCEQPNRTSDLFEKPICVAAGSVER